MADGANPRFDIADLETLFDRLAMAGFNVGPAERSRALALVTELIVSDSMPDDAAQLARWLQPVFVSEGAKRALFADAVAAWAGPSEPRNVAAPVQGPAPAASSSAPTASTAVSPAPPTKWKLAIAGSGAAALLAAIFVLATPSLRAGVLAWLTPRPAVEQQTQAPARAAPSPAQANAGEAEREAAPQVQAQAASDTLTARQRDALVDALEERATARGYAPTLEELYDRASEAETWRLAAQGRRAELYGRYLLRFPDGAHVEEAARAFAQTNRASAAMEPSALRVETDAANVLAGHSVTGVPRLGAANGLLLLQHGERAVVVRVVESNARSATLSADAMRALGLSRAADVDAYYLGPAAAAEPAFPGTMEQAAAALRIATDQPLPMTRADVILRVTGAVREAARVPLDPAMSTGEMAFAAGYQSADNFLFDQSVTERALRGRGDVLRQRANEASGRETIDLSFAEPRSSAGANRDVASLREAMSELGIDAGEPVGWPLSPEAIFAAAARRASPLVYGQGPVLDLGARPSHADISPNGRQLLANVRDTVWLFDFESGQSFRFALPRADMSNNAAAFLPNGEVIVANAEGAEIWDSATGRLLARAPLARGTQISADGERVLLLDGGVARVLNMSDLRLLVTAPVGENVVGAYLARSDVIVVQRNGAVSAIGIATGRRREVAAADEAITAAALAGDVVAIAAAGNIRGVSPEGRVMWEFARTGSPIRRLRSDARGERLLTVTESGQLSLIDVMSRRLLYVSPPGETYADALFLPDTQDIVTIDAQGDVRSWGPLMWRGGDIASDMQARAFTRAALRERLNAIAEQDVGADEAARLWAMAAFEMGWPLNISDPPWPSRQARAPSAWDGFKRLAPYLSAALFLVAALAFWLLSALNRRGFLARRRPDDSGRIAELAAEDKARSVKAEQPLRLAARRLLERREGARELDTAGSVAATARAGGFFTPVQRARRRIPEYLFLIDSRSRFDHDARRALDYVERLRAENVKADFFYFERAPDRVREEIGKPLAPIETITSLYATRRLILVGDAAAMLEADGKSVGHWADSIKVFEERALATTIPVSEWGAEEDNLALALGVAVTPLTIEGLSNLPARLRDDEAAFAPSPERPSELGERPLPATLRQSPHIWLLDTPPAHGDVEAMLNELLSYLGQHGFRWFAACAVYPAIEWDLTQALGARLTLSDEDDEEPIANESRLALLSELPWMRAGYMPQWMRERVIDEMNPSDRQIVRAFLAEILDAATLNAPKPQTAIRFSLSVEGGRGRDLLNDQVFVQFLLEDPRARDTRALEAGKKVRDLLLPPLLTRLTRAHEVALLAGGVLLAITAFAITPVIGNAPLATGACWALAVLALLPYVLSRETTWARAGGAFVQDAASSAWAGVTRLPVRRRQRTEWKRKAPRLYLDAIAPGVRGRAIFALTTLSAVLLAAALLLPLLYVAGLAVPVEPGPVSSMLAGWRGALRSALGDVGFSLVLAVFLLLALAVAFWVARTSLRWATNLSCIISPNLTAYAEPGPRWAVLAVFGFVAALGFLASEYNRSGPGTYERRIESVLIDAEIESVVKNLISVSGPGLQGELTLSDLPYDPRYLQPLSGRYFQIARVRADGQTEVQTISPSLFDVAIALTPDQVSEIEAASADGEVLFFNLEGPDSGMLRAAAVVRRLPNVPGRYLYLVGVETRAISAPVLNTARLGLGDDQIVRVMVDPELEAVTDNLIGNSGAGLDGALALQDLPYDPRYSQPGSDRYFQISAVAADGALTTEVISPSLSDVSIEIPRNIVDQTLSSRGPQFFEVAMGDQRLRAVARVETIPGIAGRHLYLTAMDVTGIETSLAPVFNGSAHLYNGVFLGLALLAIVFAPLTLWQLYRVNAAYRRATAGGAEGDAGLLTRDAAKRMSNLRREAPRPSA